MGPSPLRLRISNLKNTRFLYYFIIFNHYGVPTGPSPLRFNFPFWWLSYNKHSVSPPPLRLRISSHPKSIAGVPSRFDSVPLVCVSDDMELLAVWRHNKPKTKNQSPRFSSSFSCCCTLWSAAKTVVFLASASEGNSWVFSVRNQPPNLGSFLHTYTCTSLHIRTTK